MRKQFYINVFLPTSVVILCWILGLPLLIFKLSFFESDLYQWAGLSLIILAGVLIMIKLVRHIYRKEYTLVGAILLGIPVAAIIGLISILGLFSTINL